MSASKVQAFTVPGESLGVRAAGIRYSTPDGRVLLAKRGTSAKDYPGHWAFIAGSVETGETPIVAACRESVEEIGRAPDELPSFMLSEEGFVLFGVECEPFEPTLNDEHTASVWAPLSELPSPLHPAVARHLGVVTEATAEDSARMVDTNGWFEIAGNPISKSGVFPYLGKSLRVASGFPQPEPDKLYGVYRPAEELADPACIESFRLIPWVDEHTMLGSEEIGMTPAERKGIQGVIGENVYFDGDTLRGNIKCFAEQLASMIQQADKRELSAGFRCVYEYAPGVFDGQPYTYVQRRIRGNHLALVDEGRCGPEVAVLDAADHFTFTFDAKEAAPMAGEDKNKGIAPGAIDLDTMSVSELTALAKALGPKIQELQAATAAITGGAPAATTTDSDRPPAAPAVPAKPDEEAEAMDAAAQKRIDKLETELAALKSQPGADAVIRGREARDRLAQDLSKHVGTFDHAEKTLDDVAKYGIEKLAIACDSGAEVATLRGYLAAKPAPTAAVTLGSGMDSADQNSAVAKYLAGQSAN